MLSIIFNINCSTIILIFLVIIKFYRNIISIFCLFLVVKLELYKIMTLLICVCSFFFINGNNKIRIRDVPQPSVT